MSICIEQSRKPALLVAQVFTILRVRAAKSPLILLSNLKPFD